MCDALQQPPDPHKIPVDFEDFPFSIQELFIIVNTLPDIWDSMSGSYMGKDMSLIPYLFNVYDISDAKMSLYIIALIIGENTKIYNEKLKRKAEAAKRKK